LTRLLLMIVLCASLTSLKAQVVSNNWQNVNVDSLKELYGEYKELLPEYDTATLLALSFFPELKEEQIRFKYASINSTARTTVTLGSVFKKINKQYIIIINNDKERTGMLLKQAPLDAQVALIGHELAHVEDFQSRSFLDMAWWAFSYLFVKSRAKIEMRADKTTIDHGLGWQLLKWSDYVLHYSTANKHYLKMKENKYLSPDEILRYMKENNLLEQ
jgi:hypothetical protein